MTDVVEYVRAWLKRLRDPKSKQARGVLKGERGGFCCLGHACEALGMMPRKDGSAFWVYGREAFTALPPTAMKALGLQTSEGHYGEGRALWSDNDNNKYSLRKIADIIESNPEGLFTKSAEAKLVAAGVIKARAR